MIRKLFFALIIIAIATVGWRVYHKPIQKAASTASSSAGAAINKAENPISQCTSNISGKKIIVSIAKQHMWACSGPKVAYDNPVITGMQMYPSELTPVGSYTISGKQINQTLAGSDFTGKWSDFVYYWMPFLVNKYGTYGFHDLTTQANGSAGRSESDFGNIDINAPYTAAKHGSHGCVEMPLIAMRWLYGWAAVGTKVSVVT